MCGVSREQRKKIPDKGEVALRVLADPGGAVLEEPAVVSEPRQAEICAVL
jgi:hypothetical protein